MNIGILLIAGAAIAAIYVAAVLQHVGVVAAGAELTWVVGGAVLIAAAAGIARLLL